MSERNEKHETISDIVANKRREAEYIIESAEASAESGETIAGTPFTEAELNLAREDARMIRAEADRLDAARKLEFSELRNALAELVASVEVRFPAIEYAIDRKPYLDAKKILEKTKEENQ